MKRIRVITAAVQKNPSSRNFRWGAAALTALAVIVAGCGTSSGGGGGSGSSSSPSGTAAAAGHKGGTFTILANSSFGVADPAQNYTLEEWQLLINTHDGLVQFKRVGGVEGTKIVPDLATAVPTATDGGKTYVFQIRPASSSPTAPRSSQATLSERSSGNSAFPARRRSIRESSARPNARTRNVISARAWWPMTRR